MNRSTSGRERAKLALIVVALMFPTIAMILLYLLSRLGIISRDDIQLILDIGALLFALYISIFTGYLSWRALIFAAVPRIQIDYLGDDKSGKKKFKPGENVALRFQFKNIGWWYAKPASTNTEIFINLDQTISLLRARYGSQKELVEETARRGKKNSNYFWIRGIHLYYGEEGEEIAVDIIAPEKPGTYAGWISAFSEQTTFGVYNFSIQVEA